MTLSLSLGLDLGTSGLRSAVVDATGAVLSTARATYPDTHGAAAWWDGAHACLTAQIAEMRQTGLDPSDIARIGIDGTSGSMVLTDAGLTPVSPALMYNSGGFTAEAQAIAAHAPDPHITRGPGSALARMLRLQSQATGAAHLLHQADFIAAKLMGQGGYTDHNNALKTGYDPETESWPNWAEAAGVNTALLPKPLPAGAPIAPIASDVAQAFGLSTDTVIHAGTTDSIAAFLAAAPLQNGAAVTSLGTTLAIKLLSPVRIDAPDIGLYSHRLGDGWLVGGASNTGGGVLRHYFSDDQLKTLSAQIDPAADSGLDYYPLLTTGERFPINDPNLAPRLTPRPQSDVHFLHGLLESIARIEARCYAEMEARGATKSAVIYTAGGGGANATWTALRARILRAETRPPDQTEASVGIARLIAQTAG